MHRLARRTCVVPLNCPPAPMLIGIQALLFIEELASVFMAPFVLAVSLPKSAGTQACRVPLKATSSATPGTQLSKHPALPGRSLTSWAV